MMDGRRENGDIGCGMIGWRDGMGLDWGEGGLGEKVASLQWKYRTEGVC